MIGRPAPEFVIIGAMKAGTTTLCEYLRRHSRLFMCTPKEPQYFSRAGEVERETDWYEKLFASADDGQLRGEASTCYSRWPHFGEVPARIAARVPDVRLIYLLRNPIQRAYSHYRHLYRLDGGVSFQQSVKETSEILDASRYAMQLREYARFFPREQMLVLLLDDLANEPRTSLNTVQRFLGVPMEDLTTGRRVLANPGGRVYAGRRIGATIGRVRALPAISQGIDMLPPNLRQTTRQWIQKRLVRSVVGRRLSKKWARDLSPLTPARSQWLAEHLRTDTEELQIMIGRDLTHWFL